MPILLIIVGVALIYINFKAIKKNENSFRNMLEYKKEDISDIEVELGALRMDIAESLTELQKEIYDIKSSLSNDIEESNIEVDSVTQEADERQYLLDKEDGVINEISKKRKADLIKELIEQGLNDDEICDKLSLGKGEVLLVRGLYKR